MKPTLRTRGGRAVARVLCWDKSLDVVFCLVHDDARCGPDSGYAAYDLRPEELTTGSATPVEVVLRRLAAVVVGEDTRIEKGRGAKARTA